MHVLIFCLQTKDNGLCVKVDCFQGSYRSDDYDGGNRYRKNSRGYDGVSQYIITIDTSDLLFTSTCQFDRRPNDRQGYGSRGYDDRNRYNDRGYDDRNRYNDRGYDDRNRYNDRGYDDRNRYNDRGYDDRGGYDRNRGYDRPRFGNRGYDRPRQDGGRYGREDEPPRERPQLRLQPRQKPLEENSETSSRFARIVCRGLRKRRFHFYFEFAPVRLLTPLLCL